MKNIFFISDVHLGLNGREKEKIKEGHLLSFFDYAMERGKAVYILGDLFDYWFEYKHVIPKGFHRTLTKLEDLTTHGVEVHLIVGNHDYWIGKRFTEETGVNIYYEPLSLELTGKKFYLHHGDGLNDNDKGYKILRSMLRNKLNIFLYRLLHPDIGISLAKKSSRTSRNHSSNGYSHEQKAIKKYAINKLNSGYDYVVMGHHHTPEQHGAGEKKYINLGDWIYHYSYAIFDGHNLELKQWDIKKSKVEKQ